MHHGACFAHVEEAVSCDETHELGHVDVRQPAAPPLLPPLSSSPSPSSLHFIPALPCPHFPLRHSPPKSGLTPRPLASTHLANPPTALVHPRAPCVVQVRHKDALTSLEWAAELDACAATCRTMPGCSTFISTLGSEGARPDPPATLTAIPTHP